LPYQDLDLQSLEVADAARAAVPEELARRHQVLPLASAGGRLTLAVADPTDLMAVDDVSLAARMPVDCVVAPAGQIREAIGVVYGPGGGAFADLALEPELEDGVADDPAYDPGAALDVQSVDFSVFAPASVAPGTDFLVECWAYLRRERGEVLEIAGRGGKRVELISQGPVRVPVHTELTVLLRLDGFALPRPRAVMFWGGSYVNAVFPVHAPPGLAAGAHLGEITVLRGGLRLATVHFELTVGGADAGRAPVPAVRPEPVTTAFASYASADRDEVLRRVQGIVAAGVDVFLDVLSLRAGDDWEQRLHDNIRSRDVFYLFWSRAARDSAWVDKEWRYALAQRGIGYIHPVPLADPREVPPPTELASRHFNDVLLACLASARLGGVAG
jgi:hypothetical protein